MVRRRDLLPDEADHPRADQAYYKLQIGPLERLEPPIISLRWRWVTFIETTWDRFQAAQEINGLYALGADGLFFLEKSGFAGARHCRFAHGASLTGAWHLQLTQLDSGRRLEAGRTRTVCI
jgi:hypothetical protein